MTYSVYLIGTSRTETTLKMVEGVVVVTIPLTRIKDELWYF